MSSNTNQFPKLADQKVMPYQKYKPFKAIGLKDRTWPDQVIERAPRWCSVDLRDGNQALIEPMTPTEKQAMYDLLLGIGFKEIEVGFPAASQTDFDFVRKIIDEGLIPDDVTIQVLCQAREDLITRTIEAVSGARRVIFHLYNSTSTLQRRVVFGMSQPEIIGLATRATELVKRYTQPLVDAGTDVVLEYSPESYTATEMDFAVEICAAVMAAWGPTPDKKIILNLPATVEMATPNIYADQLEYFMRALPNRDAAVISLHTHNDRGTGVAASELGLMAGADRIEGTLFGNGERTGNCDLITMAMNLFSQGVDPELYLTDMARIVAVSEACTKIPVHVRQPYAGELVFTAFSGSHQDAIRKGMSHVESGSDEAWEVPYLPIDPADVGGSYRETVRVIVSQERAVLPSFWRITSMCTCRGSYCLSSVRWFRRSLRPMAVNSSLLGFGMRLSANWSRLRGPINYSTMRCDPLVANGSIVWRACRLPRTTLKLKAKALVQSMLL